MTDIYKQEWHSHSTKPDVKNGRATFTVNDKTLELELDDFAQFKSIVDFMDAVIEQTTYELKEGIKRDIDWIFK
jgi:hypothetical protein